MWHTQIYHQSWNELKTEVSDRYECMYAVFMTLACAEICVMGSRKMEGIPKVLLHEEPTLE